MKKIILIMLVLTMLLATAFCVGCESGKSADRLYAQVIEQYRALLDARINEKDAPAESSLPEDVDAALRETVSRCDTPARMGYATKDINGDGTDELVLLDSASKVYALLTVKDHSVIAFLTPDVRGACITPDGTLISAVFTPGEVSYTRVERLVDGALTGLEYGTDLGSDTASYYKIEDGKRTEITWEQKARLDQSIEGLISSPSYTTKKAGFRFIPAIADKSSAASAPVADFSSYDAILSAYKTIVEHFSDYTESAWADGEFDDMFTFPDNETYDAFHCIFYGGVRVMPHESFFGTKYAKNGNFAYGYDKKDLNGDGVEELILMTDRYEIVAIFTLRQGKAVPLGDLCSAWIDENGRIHLRRYTGGTFDRDGEVALYEISDGDLNCLLHIGFHVNNAALDREDWYKIENGARRSIPDAEGKALYAQYDILPSDYSDTEYTRTFSGLSFHPLFENATASSPRTLAYINSTFIDGSTLTVSAVSENAVTFTLNIACTMSKPDAKDGTEQEVHRTVIAGEAVRDGNRGRYEFEQDDVRGYLAYGVDSVWVVVTESNQEFVPCRAYLFDYPQE